MLQIQITNLWKRSERIVS